ncbi:dTDP-4-dehydrorhamnose reductase [Marmoricola sp. URHB0036]|uniref:dTDP-4-dehydrorhamnose reductase n=1 Tax=Marmoricola sp. URHB0036 TaxID=1298863 RepID=UPI0003FF9049|nr:dTDP-4-dehydrorhamnose reductase [Marmoricola sp. URHB0036]
MTWLVTGAQGMLGTDVCATLTERGIEHTAAGRHDLDLTDEAAVARAVAGHDVVVNCAAWTDVDLAESHLAEAIAVNEVGAARLARLAHDAGALPVQVSTDYVFDGEARSPYDEDAPVRPRTVYGRTKAAGELSLRMVAPERHLVVRTAWLYGAHGSCFPRTIARLARERGTVDVVEDQVGQPTWTKDVADLVVRLVQADAPTGIWHATSGGETSWFGFAREVVAAAGLSPDIVRPTDSTAFPRPAARPAYSVLGHDRLREHGIDPIGPWQDRWTVAASEVLGVDQAE